MPRDIRRARQSAEPQGAGARLAGELDRNAPPPVLEKMAGKIPGAYYLCLSGLGHMPNLEAPAAFDGAIFNFLAHALGEKS